MFRIFCEGFMNDICDSSKLQSPETLDFLVNFTTPEDPTDLLTSLDPRISALAWKELPISD